jgi:hypothetical protein
MTALTTTSRDRLLRCGFALEHHAGLERRRRDCAHCGRRRLTLRRTDGFGLDSLIEIGASTVVIWELSSTGKDRQRRALRLIGWSFTALALYLAAQSTVALAIGHHAERTTLVIAWTALNNPVLRTEGRVTSLTDSWPSPSWSGWPSTPPPAGGGPTRSPATSSSATPPRKPGSSFASTDIRIRVALVGHPPTRVRIVIHRE